MDFGKTYRGKRVFGSHKTFRGLAVGIIAGVLTAGAQMLLFDSYGWAREVSQAVDYSNVSILLMGAAMGAGALIGDAVKSFFKRQIGIQPGKSWVPFDQTDFIFGALLFSVPFVSLDIATYLVIFITAALLHPVINLLGWVLHMKDKPL